MPNTVKITRRAAGGAAGAPSSLASGQLAFNEQTNVLYYGKGDNGSGVATSIIEIGGSGASGTWDISITGSAPWSGITGKPTTISGYGISDAVSKSGDTVSGLLTIIRSGTGLLIKDNSGDSTGLELLSNASGESVIKAGYSKLLLHLAAGEKARLETAGFGINTTSVEADLHIREDSSSIVNAAYFQNRAVAGSNGIRIAFSTGATNLSDNRYAYIGSLTSGTGENGNSLVFGTNASGGAPTERARIDPIGRFLYGLTSFGSNASAVFQSNSGGLSGPAILYLQHGLAYTSILANTVLGAQRFSSSGGEIGGEITFRSEADWGVTNGYPTLLQVNLTELGSTTLNEALRVTSSKHLKIGGTASRSTTEGTNQLVLFNANPPSGTLTNGVSLYSVAGELTTMTASGAVVTLGPQIRVPVGNAGAPSISVTGGATTGIFYPSTSSWAVSAGGTEVFRVEAGKVGIGTAGTPTSVLDVRGITTIVASSTTALYIKDNAVDSNGLKLYSNSSGVSYVNGGYGTLVLQTGGNDRLQIDTNGIVNIGTSGFTGTRLHLENTSAGAETIGLSVRNNSATANTAVALELIPAATGVNGRSAKLIALNNGSNQISILFGLSNGASPVEIGRLTWQAQLKLGGTATRSTSEGTNQLVLFNGASPTGTLTNGGSFYALAGELMAMNSSGTAVRLSQAFSSTQAGLVPASGGGTTTYLRADGTWAAPAGGGNVVGPASATDNALVRFDLTTGTLIQNSGAILSDTGVLTLASGGGLICPNGSATQAPLKIGVGGALLTTPEVGAIEADANCFYGTTDAGNRGVLPITHILRQESTYTLANVGTAQQLFNAATNGRLTLEVGVYEFRIMVALTGMSGTSGNATFGMAGTATLGSIVWYGSGRDIAADGATGTWSGSYSRDATLTAAPLFTAGAATEMFALLEGTFEVTVAGTWQPQITLQTTIGTAVVAAGSYARVWRMGSTTLASVGQWD